MTSLLFSVLMERSKLIFSKMNNPRHGQVSTNEQKNFLSETERIKHCKEMKKLKRKEQKNKSYNKYKEKYNTSRIRSPKSEVSKSALYKRNQRQKMKEQKEKLNQYKRRSRDKTQNVRQQHTQNDDIPNAIFKNKMAKCRALKRLKDALPASPSKKQAILKHYMCVSPTAKQFLKQQSPSLSEKVLENIKGFIHETKQKRNYDARNAMHVISASVSGEKISKGEKSKAARKLGLHPRRLTGGKRIRTSVLRSEKSCYEFTKRKTRSDITPDITKKKAYDFWISPMVSRTSPNKTDVKRSRIGPREYVSHQIQLLEKTQTEVFLEFKAKYPDFKISQRLFESYKPFFVMPVKEKHRNTCCCRQHIEVQILFKKCMEFRKNLNASIDLTQENLPVFEHLNDICADTLCNKTTPEAKCLNRSCKECEVEKLSFYDNELDTSENAPDIKWEKFEYTEINIKGRKTRTKLMLVSKKTKPGEMFNHFKLLLETFPAHQNRANWQSEQYRNIVQNLPNNHAICIHDFSENYRCSERTEIQSAYFQRTEVSIHVTILNRHAILEVDGIDSTLDSPVIVSEQFFVISPDLDHDRHYTRYVQTLISKYLKSISAEIKIMHEFTDGCSAQYKSRNCMGDVCRHRSDLGYDVLIRNYFETSHGKGPHDAAGGFLKNQADYAVLRGKTKIQTARDLHDFAQKNLQIPQSGIYKKRLFKYIDEIPRFQNINFKPVDQNRKIHQIIATKHSTDLLVRHLSCYCCDSCLNGAINECDKTQFIGDSKRVKMIQNDNSNSEINEVECNTNDNTIEDIVEKDMIIAVLADDVDYEYYLLKVSKIPHILKKNISDDWGCSFNKKSKVVKGLYYERIKDQPFIYKLVKRKPAMCYSSAIRFICAEIEGDSKIVVPEELHLDIIHSL